MLPHPLYVNGNIIYFDSSEVEHIPKENKKYIFTECKHTIR